MSQCLLPVLLLLCCGAPLAEPLTVQVSDAAGKPLADAVIAVQVKGARVLAAPGTQAQVAQQGKQFHPRVLAVQTGTAVAFPNQDPVLHHVYSFSPIRKFELKLYAGTAAAPVVFDKAGIATVGCNIHDRMAAWVVVVDTPHHAVTDAAGQARLDLPPGTHLLRAWQPALGEEGHWLEQPLTVAPGTGARVSLQLAGS